MSKPVLNDLHIRDTSSTDLFSTYIRQFSLTLRMYVCTYLHVRRIVTMYREKVRATVGRTCILPKWGLTTDQTRERHSYLAVDFLALAPLGCLAERAPLRGAPLPNSRTRGRSEVGEATNESSR